MSATNDTGQEANATPPVNAAKRSPVERAIVWGSIAVLLVVVGIEAHGKLGYSATLSGLQAVVDRSENESEYLTISAARKSIAGFPSEAVLTSGPVNGTIRLSWFSLLKSYEVDLEIELGSDDPMFLGYSTPDAPEEDFWESQPGTQLVDAATVDAAASGADMPPGMAGDPFAGGGGPRSGEGNRRGRRSQSVGMTMSQFARSAEVQVEIELSAESVAEMETALEAARPDFSAIREMSPEDRRALFTKLNTDHLTTLEKTLPEVPFLRLRQLALQHVGPVALREATVAAELGLSNEQQNSIASQIDARESNPSDAWESGREDADEQSIAELAESLIAVLTAEQQENWKTLLGPPTELNLDDIAQQGRPSGGARGSSRRFGSGQPPAGDSDRPRRPPLDQPADTDAPSEPPGA